MPLFLEKFLLPLLVFLAGTVALINPFGFDTQQRISLFVAVAAVAYFLGHTLQKNPQVPFSANINVDLVTPVWVGRQLNNPIAVVPAARMLAIRLTNLNSRKTIISEFRLESRNPAGAWKTVTLAGLDAETPIYFLNGLDFTNAKRIAVDIFEEGLRRSTPLEPNVPLKGWVIVRSPYASERPEEDEFRLVISDDEGEYVVPLRRPAPSLYSTFNTEIRFVRDEDITLGRDEYFRSQR